MSATAVAPAPLAPPTGGRRSRVLVRSTASVRLRYRRQSAALMLGATVIGLWMAFTAPSVSPVAPVAPLTTAVGQPAAPPPAPGADPSPAADAGGRGAAPGPDGRGSRRDVRR